MKHDAVAMSLLYDYYGELLTDKQRSLFDQYYNQDLSLSEIAENEGISRQGVHDAVSRAEAVLSELEQKTGCVARAQRTQQALDTIRAAARQILQGEGDPGQLAGKILAAADGVKE